MIDSGDPLLLFVLVAMSWVIRVRWRRKCYPPSVLTDRTNDIAGELTHELARVLAELRPDHPPTHQVRETVKVCIIRYESERHLEDKG